MVLANGSYVTASPTQNRDLYWAIRGGGGGNFGVVTSYEITPAHVTQIAVVNLTWNWDQAADMLDGYARWSLDAPRTVGGGAFIQLFDASPGVPPQPMVFVSSTGTVADSRRQDRPGCSHSAPAPRPPSPRRAWRRTRRS